MRSKVHIVLFMVYTFDLQRQVNDYYYTDTFLALLGCGGVCFGHRNIKTINDNNLHGKKLGREQGEDNSLGMTSCRFGKLLSVLGKKVSFLGKKLSCQGEE